MNITPVPIPAMLPVRAVAHLPWPMAERVFVIAEIGINHNGDMALAKRLIDVAKAAGCDAVKFQKRTIDVVYTPEVLAQQRESPWGVTQRAQKEGLEFGAAQYDEIDRYCRQLGIDWFASAWDVGSQAFLSKYKLRYNKIASAMLTNRALVETVAAERKLTFVSTGMCTLAEVDAAVEIMRAAECPFILMHTVSTYPTPPAELNLMAMETLRKRYGAPVGYSGHETSLEPTVMAAVLGAVAIERHITLDRTMYGSDQSASLEPGELHTLVDQLRVLPNLLGDGEKCVTVGEAAVAKKLRYWPAAQDILQTVD
ncbi:MAG TPA: N-acetylneuraminate synthase family protein [Caulobacteraceae bacterium]|nr:N-acetylneuraminate synthase family protein [Caulobacteraceae bacterium]